MTAPSLDMVWLEAMLRVPEQLLERSPDDFIEVTLTMLFDPALRAGYGEHLLVHRETNHDPEAVAELLAREGIAALSPSLLLAVLQDRRLWTVMEAYLAATEEQAVPAQSSPTPAQVVPLVTRGQGRGAAVLALAACVLLSCGAVLWLVSLDLDREGVRAVGLSPVPDLPEMALSQHHDAGQETARAGRRATTNDAAVAEDGADEEGADVAAAAPEETGVSAATAVKQRDDSESTATIEGKEDAAGAKRVKVQEDRRSVPRETAAKSRPQAAEKSKESKPGDNATRDVVGRGEIEARLRVEAPAFKRCLNAGPSVAWTLTFDVGADGRAQNVRVGPSSQRDTEAGRCLSQVVRGIAFPAPPGAPLRLRDMALPLD